MKTKKMLIILITIMSIVSIALIAVMSTTGKKVQAATCSACHGTGTQCTAGTPSAVEVSTTASDHNSSTCAYIGVSPRKFYYNKSIHAYL